MPFRMLKVLRSLCQRRSSESAARLAPSVLTVTCSPDSTSLTDLVSGSLTSVSDGERIWTAWILRPGLLNFSRSAFMASGCRKSLSMARCVPGFRTVVVVERTEPPPEAVGFTVTKLIRDANVLEPATPERTQVVDTIAELHQADTVTGVKQHISEGCGKLHSQLSTCCRRARPWTRCGPDTTASRRKARRDRCEHRADRAVH